MAICGNLLLSSSIIFLAFAIWFNSSEFKPMEYHFPPPPPLTGPLALNKPKILEKLLEGELIGPESIVVEKNTIYTCTMDGKCLKIVDGKIVKTIPMTKNKGCEALTRQSIAYCGRPLGIRRRNDKQFIVADAALGIIGIDFEKESVETLLSTTKPIDGLKMRFPDDFDFIDNDTIVFSDASTRYGYRDFLLSFLEHGGDGRIIKFKFSTGETQVLVDGLDFPNGVQMHTDKQSFLFCESVNARIYRFYFAGPKKGRLEIFIDNLPGYPDNIRISSSGTSFYVALFSHRNADNQDLFQKLGDWLMTRKVLGMLFRIFPSTIVEILFNRGYGIAIEIDLDGKIIRSFHDIYDSSQLADDGSEFIYLASYNNKFIGRMTKN